MRVPHIQLAACLFLLQFSIFAAPQLASSVPQYTFKVVHVFPHDSTAFTQGLVFRDGFLYEGTGIEGRSSLRKVRLETSEVLKKADLSQEYFGEGIAILGDEVVQLTWKSQIGFVFRLSDFSLVRRFHYEGEGWGLASNGKELYMSDGSSSIRVLDGSTLQEKRRFEVRDGDEAITELNELEFVEGELFAN